LSGKKTIFAKKVIAARGVGIIIRALLRHGPSDSELSISAMDVVTAVIKQGGKESLIESSQEDFSSLRLLIRMFGHELNEEELP